MMPDMMFPRRLSAMFLGPWLALCLVANGVAQPVSPLTADERGAIYQVLRHGPDATEAPLTRLDDATLASSILSYAVTELGLRISPQSVDRFWAISPPPHDVRAEFEAARKAGRLPDWIAALRSPHPEYRALASEICRYKTIVDGGGWQALPAGPVLAEGASGPAVAALRRRLGVEGYQSAAIGQASDRFDGALVAQVKLFQKRHDLEEDGRVGPATRAALDVSAEDRLTQLEANLERWRWLPRALPATRVEVDVGAATATLFVGGRPDLEMRAIVGDPDHRTPMFASRLEAVIFNPAWNVPASIARNELFPREAREPGYLVRNDFVHTPNGLQQRPGPKNALGQLKFDLPSPFGVYLHDTPGKASFARPIRTLSHGCMRLEKPRDLAARLLAAQGWDAARIEAAIASGETRRVEFAAATPLFVVYRTASVGADGWAILRRDPYGWDRKLALALVGKGAARLSAIRPASECAVLQPNVLG